VYAAIVRLVGLGSIVACTIVIVAFALFAINETGTASTKQQQSLASGTALATPIQPANAGSSHKSPVRNAIEEASEWLTSPFSGVTSGSHSEWAIHAIDLLLALLVYGFCVGFLARTLRVRM
jgi:hypothetical protein